MARKDLTGKKPSSQQGRRVNISAFINSYVTEARAALAKQRPRPQPDSNDDNDTQKHKRSKPNYKKPASRTSKPVRIKKCLLHLPEFAEDVLHPGVDHDTDLAIQLLAEDKYYKPHHFKAWKHHLTEPVRKPATLPQDPMMRILALQREIEHTALYSSTVAPQTVERPEGYAKVRIRGRYAHVDSLGQRKAKEAERQFGKCTSCTVQGFECSGHRPICSQCFYSKSEFTASFGAKDKSMCSYPVEAQKVGPMRVLTEEGGEEKTRESGRLTKSGPAKTQRDQAIGDEEGMSQVLRDRGDRPKKSTRGEEDHRWEVKAQKGRLLFDRNMAAGVDFLLRSEQEGVERVERNISQQPGDLEQHTQDSRSQGHPEGSRPASNGASTWIEQRFFESQDASELDFERPSLTKWKRKVKIGSGEDILEIAGPDADQARPMVLSLQSQVTEALHQDRMHEKFLDRAAPNGQNNNVATSMAARALERWGTELDSSEKKDQVIEADLDGAHFRHVIGHSGFDRTLRGEKSRKVMQARLGEKCEEQQLAHFRERVEAWKAEKANLKRSLPQEEYRKLKGRYFSAKNALREHARQLEEGGAKQRPLKRSSKVPKFRKRMEKSFRPWVPDQHETVERSQCDLPETTFLQSLHQYASYYYTHAQPCPDVFESMDLTAQIALGMIVQETISDFAYKLGKQAQVVLDVSDDDRDSERIASDVSDNEVLLTEEDADAANEDNDKDRDVGDRDEEMEEDTSDDGQKAGQDVDDEEEDDGYMSL